MLFKATSTDTPQSFAGEIDAEANLETENIVLD